MESHKYKILFLGMICLFFSHSAMGQEKFNISAGMGYPELINLGIRYQMGQSQVGISAGYFPDRYTDFFSVGADYFYHFGGTSTLSARRTWYGRLGLNHYTIKDEFEKKTYLFLAPRIGKDFNLSPRWGIAADAGVTIFLSRQRERLNEEFYFGTEQRSDFNPSLGFSIFYRL